MPSQSGKPFDSKSVVAEVIRDARKAKNLSQEALAAAAGLHRTYISLVERGRRSPTVGTLAKIGAALEVEPEVIFSRIAEAISARLGATDSPADSNGASASGKLEP